MAQALSHGTLAGILRARAIAIDDKQIEEALRDAETGPELAAWAATHLTEDTLLTLDELELYEALQRSGQDEALAGQAAAAGLDDNGLVSLPLSEAELRTATTALERATTTIQKQTDAMRQQHEAVARLDAGSAATSSRAAFQTRQQQRWDTSRADLAADVERTARALDDRVGDLDQQNRALARRVQQTVEGLCRSDDTLLASLQKLGWALPVPTTAGNEAERRQQRNVGRLRDICLHLIRYGVETIRTKLDRLYLEALAAVPDAAAPATPAAAARPDELASLQEELESLYAEILPVAQMSVEQQHLEPALRALSGRQSKNTTRALLALDYVDACLAYLLEHVALLARRIDTAAAHHAATAAILAQARTELAVAVPTASSRQQAAAAAADSYQRRRLSNYGSPVRRWMSGAGPSHMRTRSGTVGGSSNSSSTTMAGADARAQRRRSSGFGADFVAGGGASPLDRLLEGLSLLLPMEEPEATAGGGGGASAAAVETATRVNARFLSTTLADRAAKADGVAAHAQEAFEAATRTSLADARRALWTARASVLAESPFGDVQLVDPEIDGSIGVMADEVQRLHERQAAVAAELGQARRTGSAKRTQMVQRWG